MTDYVNYKETSRRALIDSNVNRRLGDYPEEVYGDVGTEERRRNTKKCVQLRANYGITLQAYNDMHDAQGGVCKICKQPESGVHKRGGSVIPLSLSVDHCHETGAVRALLCGRCNKALGLLNDDPNLFDIASAYLKAHAGG